MKKLFYCLLAAGVMASCSNEIEVPVQEQTPEHQIIEEGDGVRVISRAAGDEYDPVSQLEKIVFYLENQGMSSGYYLHVGLGMPTFTVKSGKRDTAKLCFDRYNGYQGKITGLRMAEGPYISETTTKKYAKSPENHILEWIPETNNYYLSNSQSGVSKLYMYNKATKVYYDSFNPSDFFKWQIVPDEEFLLNKITYDFIAGDNFTVIPKTVTSRSLINNTSTPATRTIEISEEITQTSTYEKVKGVDIGIKVSNSFKTGFPIFAEGKIETEFTENTTFSWTHGHTETQKYTFKETVEQMVPAYSTYVVRVIANEYTTDITYNAHLIGVKSGLPVILRGRWKGLLVKETDIEIYDANERLLTSYSLPVSYE